MTEHEIERMVVRLMGDPSSYQKMMEEAQESSNAFKEQTMALTAVEQQHARVASQSASTIGRFIQGVSDQVKSLVGDTQGFLSSIVDAAAAKVQNLGKVLLITGGLRAGIGASVIASVTAASYAYAALGVEIRQLEKDHKLGAVSMSIYKVASEATGIALKDLIKVMPEGSKEFKIWARESRELGHILDDELVKAAKEFTEAQARMKSAGSGFWNTLGSIAVPALTDYAELVTATIKIGTKWVQENKPLIRTILDVVSAMVTFGSVTATLGGILLTVGSFITPFTASLGALAGVLTLLEYRTGLGGSLWEAYGENVRKTYETVRTYLDQMVSFTMRSFEGVKNAILAGDPTLAVEIIWASAKVAWIAGLLEIDSLTEGYFGGILQNLAAGNWKESAESAMTQVKIAFQEGLVFVDGLWTASLQSVSEYTAGVRNYLDELVVDWINKWDYMSTTVTAKLDEIKAQWDFYYAIVSGLLEGLTNVWNATIGIWLTLMVQYRDFCITIMSTIGKVIMDVLSAIGSAIQTLIGWISSVFSFVFKTLGVAWEVSSQTMQNHITALKKGLAEVSAVYGKLKAPEIEAPKGPDPYGLQKIRERHRLQELEMRQQARLNESNRLGLSYQERKKVIEEQLAELQQEQAVYALQGNAEAVALLNEQKQKLEAQLKRAEVAKEQAEFKKPDEAAQEKAIELLNERNKLLEEGKRITERYEDPTKKLIDQYKDLKKLLDVGAINKKVFDKATEEIISNLQRVQKAAQIDFRINGMDAAYKDSEAYNRILEDGLAFLEREKQDIEARKLLRKADTEVAEAAAKKAKEAKDAEKLADGDPTLREGPSAKNPLEEIPNARSPFSGEHPEYVINDTYSTEDGLDQLQGPKQETPMDLSEWEKFAGRSAAVEEERTKSEKELSGIMERLAIVTEEEVRRPTIKIEPLGLGVF